jgi:hypothetical protein
LISYNDSLYIFTKNWIDQHTNIYPLSKLPGNYTITKIDSFNSQCLITGGTYNPESNKVVLSGYTLSSPFVIELEGFTFPKFSNGNITKYPVTPPSGYSIQMEAVIHTGLNEYFLTTEKRNGDAALYKLTSSNPLSVEFINSISDSIFPNPASSTIEISYKKAKIIKVYNITGALELTTSSTTIDVTGLQKGTYILLIYNQENMQIGTEKLIIK